MFKQMMLLSTLRKKINIHIKGRTIYQRLFSKLKWSYILRLFTFQEHF